MPAPHPALGVLECASIARGLTVADALVKRAVVELLRADPVTPGKYVLVFAGGEEEVLESLTEGRAVAASELLDTLILPQAHAAIVPALDGVKPPALGGARGALGVLEMRTVSATLLATDSALKAADVKLAALHLARGIDGKGYAAFVGAQDAVEACLEAGDGAAPAEHRAGRELIASPHTDLAWALGRL